MEGQGTDPGCRSLDQMQDMKIRDHDEDAYEGGNLYGQRGLGRRRRRRWAVQATACSGPQPEPVDLHLSQD